MENQIALRDQIVADHDARHYQTRRELFEIRDANAYDVGVDTNDAEISYYYHLRLFARLLRVKQFQRKLTQNESNVLDDAFESFQYVHVDAYCDDN
jgi:hypothetical protein